MAGRARHAWLQAAPPPKTNNQPVPAGRLLLRWLTGPDAGWAPTGASLWKEPRCGTAWPRTLPNALSERALPPGPASPRKHRSPRTEQTLIVPGSKVTGPLSVTARIASHCLENCSRGKPAEPLLCCQGEVIASSFPPFSFSCVNFAAHVNMLAFNSVCTCSHQQTCFLGHVLLPC